jgi:hypothetical protein
MEHMEENSEKIWNIWKKSELNSEKIWNTWKKSELNSEKIGIGIGWQTFVRNVIIEINNVIMKLKWRWKGQITSERASS